MSASAGISSVAFSDAKNKLSALTKRANRTGMPFVITKNRRPWVEVRPLAVEQQESAGVAIRPLRREVSIPNLDELFEGCRSTFVPQEDAFSSAVGSEEI